MHQEQQRRRRRGIGARARGLAVAVALAMTSGCVIAAEAELPEVEVASKGIVIPAAPPEADGNEVPISVTFRQKPNRAGLDKESFQEVRVLSVVLTAASGVTDMSFLRTLRISATTKEREAAGKPAVPVVAYARPAVRTMGPSIEIRSQPPADITELWKASEMAFQLDFAGQLPTVAWTADVGLRVAATLKY